VLATFAKVGLHVPCSQTNQVHAKRKGCGHALAFRTDVAYPGFIHPTHLILCCVVVYGPPLRSWLLYLCLGARRRPASRQSDLKVIPNAGSLRLMKNGNTSSIAVTIVVIWRFISVKFLGTNYPQTSKSTIQIQLLSRCARNLVDPPSTYFRDVYIISNQGRGMMCR
jgi:hypothetical protein